MFKKCDISGNEVSMCIRRGGSITSLKEGITKEDTLCGHSEKFILANSEYVDKKGAPKHMRREIENRLIRKEKRMRNLIIQNRRGHAIDQIASG